MKKFIAIFAISLLSFGLKAQQVKYYLSMAVQQPWGTQTNINAMNTAFGAGNWVQSQYAVVNVNALLQPSVCLIFMEGGSLDANAMNNFIQTNLIAIQNWVFAGGRLFINAAPNQGGNINYGFGGNLLNYLPGPWPPNCTNAPGQAGHPIFNGPFLPCGPNYTGNWWCHGYVTGPSIPIIVSNNVPGASLREQAWGAGWVMFGSMTTPNWHQPAPNAANLLANILTYLAVCCQQPTITAAASSTILCSGQSATITGAGAGVGGTYTINPGAIISNSAVVTPTATTIYTIAGTNTANCQGTKTLQIVVNPNPTVTPGNNGPLCKGSTLNLTVNPSGGNPVLYNWVGPNGYTSPFQNPQVTNVTPTATGVYTVTVSSVYNTATCSASGTTAVFVVNTASISTSNYTLCQGASLTLTAGVLGANSFTWNGPNSFTSNVQNPNPINNVMPIASGNYTVGASFTTPGTTLICTSNAISNVSVVATSPVTLTIPNNICEHQTAVISASTNPAAASYSWTGPNGFNSITSGTTIPSITAAANGLYNVVATWAIGTVSCNINNSGQISVVPVPPISISAPTAVCYPANVSLTSNAPGAISYSWNGPASFTSNISSPLMASPNTNATGIYTVTTAFTNGALICYNTNTTQVTVNPILTFTLPPYRQMCFNSTYTLSGPNGATTYSWNGPNGYTNNNQILSIPAIQSGMSGTYTLDVMLGPCKTSATTKVEVLSPISFTSTPGNKVICQGDSVKLTMGSTGGSQNYAYVWNPQQYLGSPTGSVQYGHPQGTTIYNVTGYDIACPNYSISTSFTITVNKAPVPQLKLEKVEGCQPLCLKYNTQTQEDATSVIYDFGQGNLMQGDDFSYCIDNPGTYNLKIQTKGKNGCSATYNHPAPIIVHPTPHTELNWSPEKPSTTMNEVTFQPNHSQGNVVEYSWQFQGANGVAGYDTASVKNPSRIFSEVGNYPVLLISKTDKGCIDTVFKVLEIRDDFTIYIPNTFTPNHDNLNDIFNIKGVGLRQDGFSMEIYDRWGALIYSTNDVNKGWDGTVKGILAENAVYVYKIKAMGANGEGKKEYVGHVTLLK